MEKSHSQQIHAFLTYLFHKMTKYSLSWHCNNICYLALALYMAPLKNRGLYNENYNTVKCIGSAILLGPNASNCRMQLEQE